MKNMKILYGINGTGNGHITKSLNIISNLKKLGYKDIDILISGDNYSLDVPFKYKFHGFSLKYSQYGSIDYIKTVESFKPIQFLKDCNLDISKYNKIITDFEPITAWACKKQKVSCLGISHQYSFLSDKSPRPNKINFLGEFILNNMAPVDNQIGLHFKKYDENILYPIIRDDILYSHPIKGRIYIVYLPSYSLEQLLSILSKHKAVFEIFTKEVNGIRTYKNCLIKPNSIKDFTKSFINCKGIITSAGFETPAEAMYMKKKLMCIPILGQYEQLCNAESLKELGVMVKEDLSEIDEFLYKRSSYNFKWEDPMTEIINRIIHYLPK